MARLILLDDGKSIPYEITEHKTVIGRHPHCEIRLDSNTVSRRHARIVRQGSQFFLEDMGSGNGTFLNGQRVHKREPLGDRDQVRLGPLRFRFETAGGRERTEEVPSTAVIISSDDGHDKSRIMASVSAGGGFGGLDVQPSAKLKAVLEISRTLAGTVEPKPMFDKVLDSLFTIFPYADRGCALLKEQETGEMVPISYKHRRDSDDASLKLSRTIVQKVLTDKHGILSADAAQEFDMSESISSLAIHSVMCAPLLGMDGEPIGLMNIDSQDTTNEFQQMDLDLLVAVAGQAALSYESTRLMSAYYEKQKQDREMRIARDVQRALLPEELPQAEGYEFYASYDAAQDVGGDYYDAMKLDDDHICLAFGDVAGKGVPGALIMSRISSCVQNTMSYVHDVGQAIAAINNHMCDKMVEGRFVTFVLVILDVRSHRMSLAIAGHMSPMVLKTDGTLEEFDDGLVGLPLGVKEDYPFDVAERDLAPGETVILFTDGVDEAMDPDGELYTLERMRKFLVEQGSHKADELGMALLADVRRHAAGRPQNDDITIMTFGRNA